MCNWEMKLCFKELLWNSNFKQQHYNINKTMTELLISNNNVIQLLHWMRVNKNIWKNLIPKHLLGKMNFIFKFVNIKTIFNREKLSCRKSLKALKMLYPLKSEISRESLMKSLSWDLILRNCVLKTKLSTLNKWA